MVFLTDIFPKIAVGCPWDMKWSNKSNNYIKHEEFVDNMDELIDSGKSDKPTLSTIENHVIILPPDTKVEPVIEKYIFRSQYFVEYRHFHNNGRSDGFIDHKNNMYVLNNEYAARNRSVNSYIKCTNHMISFGAISLTQY